MTLAPSYARQRDLLTGSTGHGSASGRGGAADIGGEGVHLDSGLVAEELCVLSLVGGLAVGALLGWVWLLLPRR